MKARLLSNSLTTERIARSFINLVRKKPTVSALVLRPQTLGAHEVLESFQDLANPLPDDPAPPVKSLKKVLTRDLQEIPDPPGEEGRMTGARLYDGRQVRLKGIPERQFVVVEVSWDYESVRIREPATGIYYSLPWDSLVLGDE